MGPPWEHWGATLGLEGTFGPPREHLGSTAALHRLPRGDTRTSADASGTPVGASGNAMGAPWDHLGVPEGTWGAHGITLGSPWGHLGVAGGTGETPGAAVGSPWIPGGGHRWDPDPLAEILAPARGGPGPARAGRGAGGPGRARTAKTALFAKSAKMRTFCTF